MILNIDFDGTLVDGPRNQGERLRWLPGARLAIRSLLKAGHDIEVWSCRNNPTVCPGWMLAQMVRWFCEDGLCDINGAPVPLHWAPDGSLRVLTESNGKPYADVYIDDRALRYSETRLWPEGSGWPKIAEAYGLEGATSG